MPTGSVHSMKGDRIRNGFSTAQLKGTTRSVQTGFQDGMLGFNGIKASGHKSMFHVFLK